jgi:hypothetical protein
MNRFSPHLEILPAPQRTLWNELTEVSREFVLYGGTALALHLAHRVQPSIRSGPRLRVMKPIPATAQMLGVAPRIIWFEPPERALANPVRFMAYAMTYARHEDMRVIREYVSDDDFREALDRAPPGIIDPRSWAYWNSKMGRFPPPPLPKRHFGNDEASTVL